MKTKNATRLVITMCAASIVTACQMQSDSKRSMTRSELLAQDRDTSEVPQLTLSGEEERTPATMDELFDDFFFNYATNPRLQLERTNFPLHLHAFGSDMAIERKEWQHESFFGDDDFYTVFFCSEEDMDLESDPTRSTVELQLVNATDSTLRTFHFDRQDGLWKLTREVMGELEHEPLADFYFFYNRFTADSVFQRRSISRSLRFTTSDPDDDFNTVEGTLTPDQWFAFAPELPKGVLTNILYGQTYANPSKVVMLKRGISNGLLDIFTFVRRDGDWKLTAYEN